MSRDNLNMFRYFRFTIVCWLAILFSLPVLSFGNITAKTDSIPGVPLLSYIDKTGKTKPIRTLSEWQTRRRQIQEGMQAAMGKLPSRKHLPRLNIKVLDSLKTKTYTRYNIRFTVAADEVVTAFLYVPIQTGIKKRLPAMLALHPTGELGKKITDGQGGPQNRAYAKELAEKGYVVIAPDYPSFGDQKEYDFKTDRYQSGTMKSIFDNMHCVDLLQSRPDVDPERIGVIGHSLGGHNAIFAGVFDSRLKVVVSSCGWTLMHDYFNGDTAAARKNGGKLWAWAQERYMPMIRDKYNLDPDKLPFDFDELISAIAPRAFFSNSPVNDANFNIDGIRNGIANVSPVYDFFKVPQNLQVRYPDSQHDFPMQVRWQAYYFIDSLFGLTVKTKAGYSYLNSSHYFKKMELFATQKDKKTIVMLGNSLTAGGRWDTVLQRNDVANRGIGGDITQGYIARVNDVFDLKPAICFIEGGVNDLSRGVPQEDIVRNLSALIDTIRSEKIIPVLNTVTYVADNYKSHDPVVFNNSIRNLNLAIETLARKKNVLLIDLNAQVSDEKYLLKKYAVADGIHFNADTYALWGKEVVKVLSYYNLSK